MKTAQKLSRDQYFASLPPRDFIDEAHARIQDYYSYLRETSLYWLWRRSYMAYYGARLTGAGGAQQLFDSAELAPGGKKGELTHFKVNHYRSLVKHTLQLATGTKPAYSCRAANSDYKSQTQAILGNGLLDYYLREKKLQRTLHSAVEMGLALSEGWIFAPWNPQRGEEYGIHPDTGAVIYEGDLELWTKGPLDVVRDVNLSDEDEFDWLLVRDFPNKWELAAEWPAVGEELTNLSTERYSYEDLESFLFTTRPRGEESDRLCRWHFIHRKTKAMPQGRLVSFVGDILLFDGAIPYRRIPLHRFAPDKLIGTPFSYSPAFDILGPQQALDILNSTIMSNNASHGVQSIWTKRNDNVTVTTLEGGAKHFMSDEMPQPIQLTNTAKETFQFRNEVVGEMETLIGISATVRGNPEANLKSGAALALVVSQSIQFASAIEASYNQVFEDVGTDVIMQLRDFSQTKRVANILGESSRPYQREFSGDDLASINRVVVEATNPLSKTISGRIEIAKELKAEGMIETPKQYISVLTTGQLDPAIEGTQHELLNIRAENENLRNGKDVVVILTDPHMDHVREHTHLLASPDARMDPEFVQRTLDHVQAHLDAWRSMDPALLMITNQPPPPPLMAPGMPPPPGSESAPNGEPGAPVEGVVRPDRPGAPQEELPDMPRQAQLPKEAPPEAQAALDSVA